VAEIKRVYEQIKDHIGKEADKKRPGEYLRSEVQYSKLFKVSRPTVRKAVEMLVKEEVVDRIPGKGIVVHERSHKKGTLLLAIPYVPDDGFFYKVIAGCIDAANRFGYDYVIANHNSEKERFEYIKRLDINRFQAAILTVHSEQDIEILKYLSEASLPFVLVDNPVDGVDCPYVITDDHGGGYMMAEYLIRKGHIEILYLTLDREINTVMRREAGFKKALKDYGIKIREDRIIRLARDEDVKDIILGSINGCSAVCAYSDLPVIMAYNELVQKGIRVPDDISLAGYGDFAYSSILPVPLTTVRMPVYDMGYKAVEIVDGKDIAERLVLGVELVQRQSVLFK
jgi:DNA-binding LacI/PurR family transcriptional regulator